MFKKSANTSQIYAKKKDATNQVKYVLKQPKQLAPQTKVNTLNYALKAA
jgi:hypothetical protein